MHAIPGSPFTTDEGVPEEIIRAMERHYHLDDPLLIQYKNYLKGLMSWDFGPSFKYQGRSATSIISDGLPVSLTLGAEALFLALSMGILLGSVAALKRNGWQDVSCMIAAVVGISVPSFIMATFLQYIFSMQLDLLPVARWGGISHAILPALALSAMPTAFLARLTRANMVEVLQQDFILTARSKGLNAWRILFKHVLRNTLIPIVTFIGPLTASVLTGSFVVERIFGIPGLGQWFVMSVQNRDYTVIMALTIFYSALLMLCVFIVDILYCLIDPRIKLDGRV
jgi:oligopeptide transport system permease protein